MSTIVLSDHDSFVSFFRKFVAGEITNDVEIKFEPPKFEKETPFLKVEGDDYNSTINDTVMEALLAYQKNITNLYSLVTYGKVKKNLKADEYKAIKVIFQVNEGSSIFERENIEKITEVIMSTLTGGQITAIAVVGLLLYFTPDGVNYYWDKVYDYKNRQLDFEESQADKKIDLEEERLDLERSRMDREFVLDVIKGINGSDKLLDGNKKFSGKLEKLSKQADVVEYSGHTISSSSKKNTPKKVSHRRIDGKYRILRLDAEHDAHFKAKIENVDTGDKFNAILKFNANSELKFTHEDELSKMYQAFVERTELDINVNIIILDGKITNAFVMSINEPVETE